MKQREDFVTFLSKLDRIGIAIEKSNELLEANLSEIQMHLLVISENTGTIVLDDDEISEDLNRSLTEYFGNKQNGVC